MPEHADSSIRPSRPPAEPRLRVAAVVIQDEQILLVGQTKGDATYWLLPGGGVQRGESLREAVARELEEECGLTAEFVGEPLGIAESISPDSGLWTHVVHLIYPVDVRTSGPATSAATEPRDDPAIVEIRWFPTSHVANLVVHPPINDLIEEWMEWHARHGKGVRSPDAPETRTPFLDAGPRWID